MLFLSYWELNENLAPKVLAEIAGKLMRARCIQKKLY